MNFTATSSDGATSGAVPVNGNSGARYFGFYSTGSATIASITVNTSDPTGFAIGEFGISDGTIDYTVNTEAWVPFTSVADPLLPTATGYPQTARGTTSALDPNCFTPPPAQQLSTAVSSSYNGDDHTDFGTGSYRLRTEVSFVYSAPDATISDFTQDTVPAADATTRTKVYTSHGSTLDTCTQVATGSNTQVVQQTSAHGFQLGYTGGNPLIPSLYPTSPVHSAITGTVAPDGRLTLRYTTTEFPSHGLQVLVSGTPVTTDTENDTSCLAPSQVKGTKGASLMASGLRLTEAGSLTVSPVSTVTQAQPSPLC